MTLTEFFLSLQNVDRAYNKYATFSLSFNNPYRICTSYDAFRYEKFDNYLKNWLAEQGKVIAMPNMVNGEVTAILFRSITSKIFRYYNECPYIPYGAGVNNKQDYSRPWLIVESALDSDFLRNFYPYVIATMVQLFQIITLTLLRALAQLAYAVLIQIVLEKKLSIVYAANTLVSQKISILKDLERR